MESLKALVGGFSKTSTDCIEHRHWLNLATVALLIDHDRRVDVSAILLPIADLLIDPRVVYFQVTPFAFIRYTEAIFDTVSGLGPIKLDIVMCSPRAVLINDRETCLVNPIDVVPPQLSLVRSLYVFPNAELAKIFQHDISTLLVSIRGLNCAVATASEAVVF